MALTENKVWYDKVFISVSKKNSGTEVQLRKTTSLSITGGNFDIESIDTFSGKVKRVGSREDIEISFDGVPTDVQTFDWIFHGRSNSVTSITSSSVEDFRITILWTDQTGVTSATQAISTSSEAYRQIYAEANCTSLEYNMDAGEELTATMTLKLAYEDEDGNLNFKKEMCDTSSALSAVPAYSGSTKF